MSLLKFQDILNQKNLDLLNTSKLVDLFSKEDLEPQKAVAKSLPEIIEAIESIYTQSYANWEIIFWDNASTDSTREIAQSFGSKIKYFCSDENMPLGYARNLAFKKANGEFIAFLDDDDLWMPSKLEEQIPLFNNSNVGLVYGNLWYQIEKKKYAADFQTKCLNQNNFKTI